MSAILQSNLILGNAELARDVIQSLYSVLRKYRAEMFFYKPSWSVLLWVADQGSNEAHGKYRVVGMIRKLAPLGTEYVKGVGHWDPQLVGNTIRPSNFAQVEDIVKAMIEVLAKFHAALEFDQARKGLVLTVAGVEVALVYNITRFGAELDKGAFRFLEEETRPKVVIDENDIADIRKRLGR